ncbi:hypothetical protein J2787_000389 [Chryseobacterium rhizosphaerae]|uniref:Uncharacterized protein n=1 Tax=Chryseobacterium rhizosphaerae TaxID=395937 RepID=A0AAE4BZX4_9FLAO|nr:hypothetical protein [Chryseobacterium rhizosphaerae]MDR6525019.1 hypothetical protein [Chryseobacterium rhizosphaerae]
MLKSKSLFVIFEGQQTRYQATDWNEVTELYKLLLLEKFDIITSKVK